MSAQHIGVLTSGGDAPGMNACVRAVVRTALCRGVRASGIHRGYAGLIAGEIQEMARYSVSNIIQHGGTLLKTARCQEFFEPEGRKAAAATLRTLGIDGLVVIGGDGSFHGAHALWQEQGISVIGVPGTIDADIYGSDSTIGFDTAVNTAVEAIDRVRDTAESHDRLFFVEVMGRNAGFIGLHVAVACGAEAVLVPGVGTDLSDLTAALNAGRRRGKRSYIVIVAEGEETGHAMDIARKVGDELSMEYRVCVLGHIQRGGAPSAADRVLASQLGVAAVDALLAGETDKMVGRVNGEVVLTPFEETWTKRRAADQKMYALVGILGT